MQHQNCLATSDRSALHFYFSLAVSGSIGDNSNSPISEFIAINPSFSMCSSKISARVLILTDFLFFYD